MNTSATSVPRDPAVQSRIQKIRTFSRSARAVCALILGFGLVGYAWSLLIVPFVGVHGPENIEGDPYDLLSSVLTPLQMNLWWVLSYGAVMEATLAAMFQLYRLFGNLATGAIYTPENVRCVRRIGLLMLVLAIFHVVIPSITLAVMKSLVDGPVSLGPQPLLVTIWQSLGSFAAAGLVLLAAWVMDVGLYEKEHADVLQRDAGLMI